MRFLSPSFHFPILIVFLCLDYVQWIPIRSNDGSLVLYFDPRTKQVWGGDSGADSDSRMSVDENVRPDEASGSNTRTLRGDHPMGASDCDVDIEMAARIARTVSLRPTINGHVQLKLNTPARRYCDTRALDDSLPVSTAHQIPSHHRIVPNGRFAPRISELSHPPTCSAQLAVDAWDFWSRPPADCCNPNQ